jgi:hypothetical protein
MSRKLATYEYSKPEFDLGDFVSFTHNKWDADKEDETLYGRIVRVYGSRGNYGDYALLDESAANGGAP